MAAKVIRKSLAFSITVLMAVLLTFSAYAESEHEEAEVYEPDEAVETEEETVSEEAKNNLYSIGPYASTSILNDLKRYYSSYQINSAGTIGHFGTDKVTLASVIGVGANDIASYLDANLNSGKILGTPYSDYNWTPGVGMDCSGFVTYTICSCKTGSLDQNIKTKLVSALKSEAYSGTLASGWTFSIANYYYNLLCGKKIECYVYLDGNLCGKDKISSTDRLLADGKMEKGDIILYLYCGLAYQYYPAGNDNHMGFYYGSYGGFEDTFWHSAVYLPNNQVLKGNIAGNRISSVPIPYYSSTAILIKCGNTKPSVPTNIKATALSSGSIKVKWAGSSAGSYEIYRAESLKGSYSKIGTSTTASYTDSTALIGVSYYYKVKAVNSAGKSALSKASSKVTRKIGKVSGVEATYSSGDNSITVSWDALTGIQTYAVIRYDADGTRLGSRSVSGTSWTDTAVKSGKQYKYRVQAYVTVSSGKKYGSRSDSTALITVPLNTPELSLESDTSGVRINWTSIDGAEEYQIYRSASKNGKYKLIKSTSGSDYVDKSSIVTENEGKVFYYKVRAYSGKVSSDFSAIKSVLYKGKREDAVSILSASVSFTDSYVYEGKAITPKVKVSLSGTTLTKGKDYTVSCSNNKNPGKAAITITGIGEYIGSISKKFTIALPQVSISKAKSAFHSAMISWTPVSKNIGGYQIECSRSKTFKSVLKKADVSGKNSSQKRIVGLSVGKTYYFRIRTYKKISGKTYYSSWSDTKSVKIVNTSKIDYVSWALKIAADNNVGYGHYWGNNPDYPVSISCAGLVGMSLTFTGYGDFRTYGKTSYDWMYWDNTQSDSVYRQKLEECGFTALTTYQAGALQPGDVLYSRTHTGIYIGNNQIVEALGSGAYHYDSHGNWRGTIYADDDGKEVAICSRSSGWWYWWNTVYRMQ